MFNNSSNMSCCAVKAIVWRNRWRKQTYLQWENTWDKTEEKNCQQAKTSHRTQTTKTQHNHSSLHNNSNNNNNNNGLLYIAAQCWIVDKTLWRQHTLLYTTESQSACHSKLADRDWLREVFKTLGQERFMEHICAGSDWGKGLGISQAVDSVIVISFR